MTLVPGEEVFLNKEDAADYFLQEPTDLTEDALEQCPICDQWSVSAADHEDGAMVGVGGLVDGEDGISRWYQKEYGHHRICHPCELAIDDEYRDFIINRATTGDVRIEADEVAIDLEWIGEGNSGDYDEDDPEDQPLMRFSISRMCEGNWEQVEDASYCTQIPATIPVPTKVTLAAQLLDEVYDEVINDCSIKKLCERLSWITEKGLKHVGKEYADHLGNPSGSS